MATTRYELIDESHGEGAFGKIQKRKDNILERIVAVKILKLFDDAEARARFIQEAKTLAKLSHPNVPAIYDVDFLEKEMRIYFEYIDGENLRKFVSEKRIPSMDQIRRWFAQIGSALSHAHGLGIVHRDIKPDNIIISPDHTTATVVDFGIALTTDDARRLTATGYVIGTPATCRRNRRKVKTLMDDPTFILWASPYKKRSPVIFHILAFIKICLIPTRQYRRPSTNSSRSVSLKTELIGLPRLNSLQMR